MQNITLKRLDALKARQEKITALTAYDATFAALLSRLEIEILLVGDTLGMVFAGHSSTIPVTIDDIVYHVRCVARGNLGALLLADLPFMTYSSPDLALKHAARLMRAGAVAVKMEGGRWLSDTVSLMTRHGIPVCGHLGLTPQSVHSIGGYSVQGKTQEQAKKIMEDAIALQSAGIRLLVLECVPSDLAGNIAERLSIPVIGIGAGPLCDGQILVTYDMLGMTRGKHFTFVKDFMAQQAKLPIDHETFGVERAVMLYRDAVKQGQFPDAAHSFSASTV